MSLIVSSTTDEKNFRDTKEQMMTTEYLKVDTLYNGDCTKLMGQIKPNSVALSFWSPPYHVGKSYEKGQSYEEWLDLLKSTIKLHYEILKPGSFMVINIADILALQDENMPRSQAVNTSKLRCSVTKEQILQAMTEHPDYNRKQLGSLLGVSEQTVDRRLHGNNIRGGKKSIQTRVKLVGPMIEEYILSAGMYLYDVRIWKKDPTWANSQWHSNSYRSVSEYEYLYVAWKPGITKVDRSKLSTEEWSTWGSRGIWDIASVRKNDDHPAKFPIELAEKVIRLYTSPGDLVLDPFLGSGTTARAAKILDRHYIGIELDPTYFQLAQKNINLPTESPLF